MYGRFVSRCCACLVLAVTSVHTAAAQQVAFPPATQVNTFQSPSRNTAYPDTSGHLRSIEQRLDALEAENAHLRSQLAAPINAGFGDAYPRNDFIPNTHASQEPCGCTTLGGDGDCSSCADCGKQVCEGMPHLCGVCLEQLSWNKDNGWRIVPFGMLRGEVIYSQQEQAADAVIFFLLPDSSGVDDDQFTAHAKTSMLNFALTGPEFNGWQTGGAILMNFTGQQPLRNNSGPQVLNAYGEIKDENYRFAFGRMFDLFGPLTTSTVNMGQQRGAGNIGIFRGAVQMDRFINVDDETRWTLSGRLSQPNVNDYLLLPTARGIDNGFPNFEGRIGLALGPEIEGRRPLEVGISGLWGETRAFDAARFILDQANNVVLLPEATNVSTTAGGCIDFQLHGQRTGIRGEAWAGQAAGTYFVGILQSLNPASGNGIRSIGGWSEVYWKANDRTTFYVGYGIDDPRDQDIGFLTSPVDLNDPGQRALNQVVWTNVQHNVTEFFQLGFEVSHRNTDYVDPLVSDDGLVFHFSSSLMY